MIPLLLIMKADLFYTADRVNNWQDGCKEKVKAIVKSGEQRSLSPGVYIIDLGDRVVMWCNKHTRWGVPIIKDRK